MPIVDLDNVGSIIETPDWIRAIIVEHGGWFRPIPLDDEHPLVKGAWDSDGWRCFYCKSTFGAREVGVVLPHYAAEGARWIAAHRTCILAVLDPEARAGSHRSDE